MVCRLPTCCGISLQSPVNIRIAGGRGNAFAQGSLGDTPNGRLALFVVNKKPLGAGDRIDHVQCLGFHQFTPFWSECGPFTG